VAVGDYIWDRDGRQEIAVLGSDGAVRILQHGTLDTRPLTAADAPGGRALRCGRGWGRLRTRWRWGRGRWRSTLTYAGSAVTGPVGSTGVQLAAPGGVEDARPDGAGCGKEPADIPGHLGRNGECSADRFSGTPVAAVALPQKINAARDLVVLTTGATPLVVAEDAPDPTFNVNTTADEDNLGACTQDSTVTNATEAGGILSLREAVCEANNNGAAMRPGTI
jgi:hypothetical protein